MKKTTIVRIRNALVTFFQTSRSKSTLSNVVFYLEDDLVAFPYLVACPSTSCRYCSVFLYIIYM